jgi:hypothetical protein
MISEKQLEANRRNALNSTGPKTPQGKLIASQNATTHGLLSKHVVIDGESGQDFEDFRNLLIDYFQPIGILEQLLTNRIAASFWRLNRTGLIEVEILNSLFDPKQTSTEKSPLPFIVNVTKTYTGSPGRYEEPIEDLPTKESAADSQPTREDSDKLTLGTAVSNDFASANILAKFHRYKTHIDSTLYKAMHELQRLQATRRGQQVTAPQVLDIDVGMTERPL